MFGVFELLNIQFVVVDRQKRTLVVMNIAIVRSRKHCDHHWQLVLLSCPIMKLIPLQLNFMSSDDRLKMVSVQKLLSGFGSKYKTALSDIVICEVFRSIYFSLLILGRITP